MYDPIQFLSDVLTPLPIGSDEWYVQATIYGKDNWRQVACKTLKELLTHAQDASLSSLDAYFALATTYQGVFDPDTACIRGSVHRRREDVRSFRSVWVDLDCGDKKPYHTQDEARAALAEFEKTTGLYCTYRVNSGNGLHVYWTFDVPYFISDEEGSKYCNISLDAWQHVKESCGYLLRDDIAANFYAICTHFNLQIDSNAIDSTRVLRVPGTNNYKHNKIKPCEIEYFSGKAWSLTQFIALCKKLIDDNGISIAKKKVYRQNDESIAGQELSKYDNKDKVRGMDRILQQCEQLNTMGLGPEPLWHAAICFCLICEDGPAWAHKLSAVDTERYTPETTDFYIGKCRPSAVYCTTLNERRPGVCTRCQHFGKIKSPVQLVRQAGVASGEPLHEVDHLVYPSDAPVGIPYRSYGKTDFFCDSYGVWLNQVDDDGNQLQPMHITNAVIEYLYSTIGATADSAAEAVDVFRVLVVGTNEAFIRHFPTRYYSNTLKIMEWCGANRLLALTSQKTLAEFMNAYVRQQVANGSVNLRAQYDAYGWYQATDDSQRFVLDGYAITDKGAIPIGPVQVKDVDDLPFTRKGSLEEWKKVPTLYKTLHQELGQLAICMAFAAPFLHYGVGEAKNCVMNIYSYEGGRGKSHLLKACASVYGNPAKAFLQNTASSSATQKILATNRHLPIYMDEIGNRDDDSIATLIFTMVNGVEKQKLNRDSSMRKTGWWSTAIFTTANKPLKDVMSKVFANTDAGVLRVMDCLCTFSAPIPGSSDFDYINECFTILENNYGLAGPDFIWHILRDPARLAILPSVVNAFVVNNKFQSNERFYSYPLAIALAIGRWCVEFGLLDYDMDALERWVIHDLLPTIRKDNKDLVPDYHNDLNEFINENLRRNCIIVTEADRPDSMKKMTMTAAGMVDPYVIQYPTSTITMRYELKERRLLFSQKALSDWCKKENKSLRRMLTVLRDDNVIESPQALINLGKNVPRYAVTKVHYHVLIDSSLQDDLNGLDACSPAYVPYEQLSSKEKEQLREMQEKVDNLTKPAVNSDVADIIDKLGF